MYYNSFYILILFFINKNKIKNKMAQQNESKRLTLKDFLKISGVAGSLAIIAVGGGLYLGRYTAKSRNEIENLIVEVKQKAAGEDNLLSRDEVIKMARDLGYKGVINEQCDIDFDYDYATDKFFLENGTTRVGISRERIRRHLAE